jgi:hypothetical protein
LLSFTSYLFVSSTSLYTYAPIDGSRLKTSHAGAIHQYAPQEDYIDYHEGDTDEDIMMEASPVAAPGTIVVSDDEDRSGNSRRRRARWPARPGGAGAR